MKKRKSSFLPVLILFIILNALFITSSAFLNRHKIDQEVLIIGNLILFLLSAISHAMHVKAAKNENPHVFVRSVMGATMLKLFIIAASVLLYLILAKENRNLPAIFITLGLYIVYMVFDVKNAMTLNKKSGNMQ